MEIEKLKEAVLLLNEVMSDIRNINEYTIDLDKDHSKAAFNIRKSTHRASTKVFMMILGLEKEYIDKGGVIK